MPGNTGGNGNRGRGNDGNNRGPDNDHERLGLRIALLVGLAGAAYLGVQFALGYWRSWLLAASIIAFAVALYFLIWPENEQD